MATTKPSATIKDLEQLCDSERRFDLIRGELIEMAPAGGVHGEITAGIIGRLWAHVTENDLGRVYTSETGFVLAREPDVVLGPDAAFVRRERVPERQRGFYVVAPDLTVKVMVPNDSYHYVHGKVMEYLDAGVRLVWIVDPDRQRIAVYRADRSGQILTSEDTLDGADVLPGFSVPVARIFE